MLTLAAEQELPRCPSCAAASFVRASLFPSRRFAREAEAPAPFLAEARARITGPGDYLAFLGDEELHVLPLTRERTRIGRSLAADVRFDDATVSRRHALFVGVPFFSETALKASANDGPRTHLLATVTGGLPAMKPEAGRSRQPRTPALVLR